MLTGKAKELFDEWLKSNQSATIYVNGVIFNFSDFESFNHLPLSMQWGAYQDFAKSLKYYLHLDVKLTPTMSGFIPSGFRPQIIVSGKKHHCGGTYASFERSRTAAIEKLNELINSK